VLKALLAHRPAIRGAAVGCLVDPHLAAQALAAGTAVTHIRFKAQYTQL